MIWAIFGGVLLLLILLYGFLIFPGRGDRAEAFRGRRIAHRGLHGNGLTENTLPAFRAAREAGYGVELDVQLSSDGVPVVSHDYDLNRVFGIGRRVADVTAAELTAIGVPTLAAVLEALGGEVPLVAEIKGESPDTAVCAAAAPLLDAYPGLWCVESFNPFHLLWFRRNRPKAIRGQLSTHFERSRTASERTVRFLLRRLLLNVLGRPHFIAYGWRYSGDISLRLCRALGAAAFGWTPVGDREIAEAEAAFDAVIFERGEGA